MATLRRESQHERRNLHPHGFEFTQGAANKVKTLVSEEGNDRLKLRVFVTGGGCSGFQYGFTFDEEVAEDDTIVEREGVSTVVDPMSFNTWQAPRWTTKKALKVRVS